MQAQNVSIAQWRLACLQHDDKSIRSQLKSLLDMGWSKDVGALAVDLLLISLELHHTSSLKLLANAECFKHNPKEFLMACAVTNNIPAAHLVLKNTNPHKGLMDWAAHYAAKFGRKQAYWFFQGLATGHSSVASVCVKSWRPTMLKSASLEMLELEDGPKTLGYAFQQGWKEDVMLLLCQPKFKSIDNNTQVSHAFNMIKTQHEGTEFVSCLKKAGWTVHDVVHVLTHHHTRPQFDLFPCLEKVYGSVLNNTFILGYGITQINLSIPRQVLYALGGLHRHVGAQNFVLRQFYRHWQHQGLDALIKAALDNNSQGVQWIDRYLDIVPPQELPASFQACDQWVGVEEMGLQHHGWKNLMTQWSKWSLSQSLPSLSKGNAPRKM